MKVCVRNDLSSARTVVLNDVVVSFSVWDVGHTG